MRDNRLDKQCTEHRVEDETHLIFECKNYADELLSTFQFIKVQTNIDLSAETNSIQKFKITFLNLTQ